MDKFREFIGRYSTFSLEEWNTIQPLFERQEISKDEIFLEEGKVCRYFYFLEEGLLRFFTLKDGDDITKTFTIAPYCFTSKTSFRHQQPAKESIQALDNTVIWQISYSNFHELMDMKSWNVFIRKLVGEVQDYADDLLLEQRTETAEVRYEKLLEDYSSDLLQKIPLKHLASFLGIAPQSLSRIRKKRHNKRM